MELKRTSAGLDRKWPIYSFPNPFLVTNSSEVAQSPPYMPPAELFAPYYIVIIPILLIFCSAACLGNLALLTCIPWVRRRAMTINLRLSLSLAAADAWAALLILCGIIVNSYIPVIHQVKLGPWTACYFLIFEMLRLAGLITSALHLLILAINHWLSIIAPFRHKTLVTLSVYRITVAMIWLAPLATMFGYGFSMPREGFRNRYCAYAFYYKFKFRFVLFLQFVSPLIIMICVYGDILRRLIKARKSSSKYDDYELKGVAQFQKRHSSESNLIHNANGFFRNRYSSFNAEHRNGETRTTEIEKLRIEKRKSDSDPFLNQNNSFRTRGNSTTSQAASFAAKTKALFTTLLIVGTFAAGWLPALLVFLLICTDCVIKTHSSDVRILAVQVVVNSLMLAKLLSNPFIYGFRMLDIRYALWAMRVSRFGWRPLSVRNVPRRFNRLFTTR